MSRSSVLAAMVSVPVTPPPGGNMAGYAVDGRTATGTTDELTATVWHLLDPINDRRLVWVSLDALAITDLLHDRVTAAVRNRVGATEVLLSATHTHCGPGGWCGTIHPILPADLDPTAIDAVAAQLVAALPEPQPVTLRWGIGVVDGLGANRHDPVVDCDRSIGVLSCWQADVLTGLVVDHACHPTVLGPEHRGWSADWVGGMRRRLAAELGAEVPVLFLQGAAGDVSTRFTRAARTPEETDRIGGRAAAAVLEALSDSHDLPVDEGFSVRSTELTAARRTTFDGGAPVSSDPGVARAQATGRAALAALAAEPGPEVITLPISDIRIAGRRYLTTPLELINRWGVELMSLDPSLRVVGYTDAYRGYLTDRDGHRSSAYEATSSYFDATTSESIMEQLIDLTRR